MGRPIETFNKLWVRHRCAENKTEHKIYFNDFQVRCPTLPGVVHGCPFCWTSYLDLRHEWKKRYWARAPVASPEEVAPAVAEAVHRLERPDFPENGILNHFGVYLNVRGLGIHIANQDRWLRVTMYQEFHFRPAALHKARAEAVAKALTCSIRETWNGHDGSHGISVVLTRRAPDGLLKALENYSAMGFRCFKPSKADKAGYAAFETWYEQKAA